MKIGSWKILEAAALEENMELSIRKAPARFFRPLAERGLAERKGDVVIPTAKGLLVFSIKPPRRCIDSTSGHLEENADGDRGGWEKGACERFFALLEKNCPMKGSPGLTPACIEALEKLQRIDGYSRGQIERTLDYIAGDVKEEGFCFARNIRTPATLRGKWKNGLTKFTTAYNAMMEAEGEAAGRRAADCIPFQEAETKGERDANALWKRLRHLCPQGNAKGEFLRALGDVCRLFAEFVDRRHWPGRIFGMFLEAVKAKAGKGLHFNGAMLVAEAVDFLGKYGDSGGRGYYIQQGAMAPDERYRKRLEGFSQDFGDGVGFHEARYEEDRK